MLDFFIVPFLPLAGDTPQVQRVDFLENKGDGKIDIFQGFCTVCEAADVCDFRGKPPPRPRSSDPAALRRSIKDTPWKRVRESNSDDFDSLRYLSFVSRPCVSRGIL